MANRSIISRRSFLHAGGAAAAALALNSIQPAHADIPALPFLVVGDWGHASARARAVAAAMGTTAQSIGSRFVISVGDNFYPHGVEDVNDRQWLETFEQNYSAPSLMTPWNVVAGNHDHDGNVTAQIEYSKTSKRWRMPALYYKKSETLAGNAVADFFYIDTETLRGEDHSFKRLLRSLDSRLPSPEQQMSWLERELAASRAAWKIVVGHHPVYSGGSHGRSRRLAKRLLPLFKRYGVQVYLSGHNHNLEHLAKGGTHYLVSGAGSQPTRVRTLAKTRFATAQLGFLAVRLAPDSMNIEFIDQQGAPLYKAALPVGA